MQRLPPELLSVILQGGHRRTCEAQDGMDRLGLLERDVLQVARTGVVRKKTRDPKLEGRTIWAIVGRDTCGRIIYMAGKAVQRHGQTIWKLITIHEATD